MAGRVRVINGKGDWTAIPPTGVDTGDWTGFTTDIVENGGVVDLAGGDLLVTQLGTPGMAVQVAPGTVYVENDSHTANSFENFVFQVVQDATVQLNISSNNSGSTRIDLICQKVDVVTSPNDTASNVQELVIVEGTPGGGAPATPAYHELLTEVTVADSASTITNANISDERRQVTLKSQFLPSDTVTTTGTQTLTNKRITKRVGTVTSSTTPTPSADNHDVYTVTALAAGATFGAPTGTPTSAQTLVIRVKDNGTARSLAWNAIYRGVVQTLPTTTVINKTMYLGFMYNSADSKWDLIAVAEEV